MYILMTTCCWYGLFVEYTQYHLRCLHEKWQINDTISQWLINEQIKRSAHACVTWNFVKKKNKKKKRPCVRFTVRANAANQVNNLIIFECYGKTKIMKCRSFNWQNKYQTLTIHTNVLGRNVWMMQHPQYDVTMWSMCAYVYTVIDNEVQLMRAWCNSKQNG